jgi:AcrR family transcriptional regulator
MDKAKIGEVAKSGERKPSSRASLISVMISTLELGGEPSVRLEAILAEAEASPSSLYHHFGSLDGLIDVAQLKRFAMNSARNVDEFESKLKTVRTSAEFHELTDAMFVQIFAPHRLTGRMARIDALGRAYGNPELQSELASIYRSILDRITEAITVAKTLGWLDERVNPRAIGGWIDSMGLGRVLVDVADDPIFHEEWMALVKKTFDYMLFEAWS